MKLMREECRDRRACDEGLASVRADGSTGGRAYEREAADSPVGGFGCWHDESAVSEIGPLAL